MSAPTRLAPPAKFVVPAPARLTDPAAEQSRDSHSQAIVQLQRLPAAALRVIRGVRLPNGGFALIPHGLGRAPLAVLVSPPITNAGLTAGLINELRGVDSAGSPIDRNQVIALFAGGYGAAVTVDVVVL